MKVSLSWLREYVEVTLDPEALAEALTMAGLEVEAVEDRYNYLESVVVARVLAVNPHPAADQLTCCEISLGQCDCVARIGSNHHLRSAGSNALAVCSALSIELG